MLYYIVLNFKAVPMIKEGNCGVVFKKEEDLCVAVSMNKEDQCEAVSRTKKEQCESTVTEGFIIM